MATGVTSDDIKQDVFDSVEIPDLWSYPISQVQCIDDCIDLLKSVGVQYSIIPHSNLWPNARDMNTVGFDRTQLFFSPVEAKRSGIIGFKVKVNNARIGNQFVF